jgi:hypothetical protein
MSRIPTPATIADAPVKAKPLLEAVNKQRGTVPNMFRLIATSPQALEGHIQIVFHAAMRLGDFIKVKATSDLNVPFSRGNLACQLVQ